MKDKKLSTLVATFEGAGYSLLGKENIPKALFGGTVMNAPAVMIPSFPAVESECKMVTDILSFTGDQLKGFAKIEGAATVVEDRGMTVVRLQFVPK